MSRALWSRLFLVTAIFAAGVIGQCWCPGDADAGERKRRWKREIVIRGQPFPDRIALLVDRSGSMDGKPYARAVAEARRIAAGMTDAGRVRFYAFDDDNEADPQGWIVLPDAERVETAVAWLERRQPADGGTDLAAAAAKVLSDAEPELGVVIVTDARPNGGPKSTAQKIVETNAARQKPAQIGVVLIATGAAPGTEEIEADLDQFGVIVAERSGGAYVRVVEREVRQK